MRRVAALVAALVVALALSAAAPAHRPTNCGKLHPRAELRCARAELHHVHDALRHPARYAHHSPAYFRWREKVDVRWIKSARYRIAHPPLHYLSFWVCVHNYEGAWNDDTGNGYFGGLQMTENWAVYGQVLVWHANLLSPYEQMRVAEHGWFIVLHRQGYAYARYTWLPGQWNHPDCLAAYAP